MVRMKALYFYSSPVGKLGLVEEDGALTHLCFDKNSDKLPPGAKLRETPLLKRAAKQLDEYFSGTRREFELPLRPKGTAFQRAVWEALCAIPYGETCSYGDIAARIGRPQAARAVGGANNRNPIAIIVPCHRVIGANGDLVGFGCGLAMKEFLLNLEQNH